MQSVLFSKPPKAKSIGCSLVNCSPRGCSIRLVRAMSSSGRQPVGNETPFACPSQALQGLLCWKHLAVKSAVSWSKVTRSCHRGRRPITSTLTARSCAYSVMSHHPVASSANRPPVRATGKPRYGLWFCSSFIAKWSTRAADTGPTARSRSSTRTTGWTSRVDDVTNISSALCKMS